MKRIPSPNFDERTPGTPVDMLVLHYTGMVSADVALERMCDPQSKVSAHYMIDEDGSVTQLVEEDYRAWHAGVSYWAGNRDINARSIGIELVNPGHENGYRPFPEEQMRTLETLSMDIVRRHMIPARNVVGHSDIAPNRKEDPGELFDWFRLFDFGVGIWPMDAEPVEVDEEHAELMLEDIGYEVTSLQKSLEAFQRHFRPQILGGKLDAEIGGMLKALQP